MYTESLLNAHDIAVLVLDEYYQNLDIIPLDSLVELTCEDSLNAAGGWSLKIPNDLSAANALRQPGACIHLVGPGQLKFSGPVTKWTIASTPEEPNGQLEVEGVTDWARLNDRLIWPLPDEGIAAQGSRVLKYNASNASSLINALVVDQYLKNPVRGMRPTLQILPDLTGSASTVARSYRFENLGEQVAGVANAANVSVQLCYDRRDVEPFEPVLRLTQRFNKWLARPHEAPTVAPDEAYVVLSMGGGGVSGTRFGVDSPGSVVALSASATEGGVYPPIESIAALSRYRETFVDTNGDSTPIDAAQKYATENPSGNPTAMGQVTLTPDLTSTRFAEDWYIGDWVTIAYDDGLGGAINVDAQCTGMVLRVSNSTLEVGARFGKDNEEKDVTGWVKSQNFLKSTKGSPVRVIQGEGEPYGQGYTSADGDYYIDSETNLIYPLGAAITPPAIARWTSSVVSDVNSADVISGAAPYIHPAREGGPIFGVTSSSGIPLAGLALDATGFSLSFNVIIPYRVSNGADHYLFRNEAGVNSIQCVIGDDGTWWIAVWINGGYAFGPHTHETEQNVILDGNNLFINGV